MSAVSTGPLRWWPPELIQPTGVHGKTSYSRRSDTYMFGITCWEMLCRRVPYEPMSARDAAIKVCVEGLRPGIPSQLRDVAEPLVQVIEDCWQQRPLDRPSMEDVCERLRVYHEALRDRARKSQQQKKQGTAAAGGAGAARSQVASAPSRRLGWLTRRRATTGT